MGFGSVVPRPSPASALRAWRDDARRSSKGSSCGCSIVDSSIACANLFRGTYAAPSLNPRRCNMNADNCMSLTVTRPQSQNRAFWTLANGGACLHLQRCAPMILSGFANDTLDSFIDCSDVQNLAFLQTSQYLQYVLRQCTFFLAGHRTHKLPARRQLRLCWQKSSRRTA
jgi:hypothetical protein